MFFHHITLVLKGIYFLKEKYFFCKETELKPDNEQGERDAEKSTNVPSSENDEKQGDSEELESTTVNSAENLGTEVPANLTDSASIQETIPSELTTVDNSNPQDRIERVKENGSANGTEFLRSSGEFHDMIVVLPDDTLNTTGTFTITMT